MDKKIIVSKARLTEWAESLLHMNQHGTLVRREIEAGNLERASHLAERARKRAWKLLNELFEAGAEKPEGYCEPSTQPNDTRVCKKKIMTSPALTPTGVEVNNTPEH